MISVLKYSRNLQLNSKTSIHVKKLSRIISGDRLTPLNQETLTGRFLLYLDNSKLRKKPYNHMNINLFNVLKYHPLKIASMDTSCIVSILANITNKDFVHSKQYFFKVLHLIDNECSKRVKDLDVDDITDLLHSFVKSIPHRITECQFYHLALQDLVDQRCRLNKNQLIQLIFFIGLSKKAENAQHMLRQCLHSFNKEHINSFTLEDLCIICNSTFKTSTKIKNKLLLDKIKLYINDNLSLLNDPAVFVTFMKTLRHNRYQDEDILTTITCTIFFNKTMYNYSFSAVCHILALYADYLYYDEKILEIFSQRGLQLLKKSTYISKDAYLDEQPRLKDIKRFLWALSNLNYKLPTEDIETIIMPQISDRMKAGECHKEPRVMVDIILYLWMMKYKALDLIEQFVFGNNIKSFKAYNLSSCRNLNLLLTCIHYEDVNLFNSLKIQPQNMNYNQNIQLQKRPALSKIIENLEQIAVENDIDKFDMNCQIPSINIIGITGFQKKIYRTVNIEVLDNYTCLKNTDCVPTGLMQLKLRLLEKCNEGLIVIESKDITDFSDMELQGILQDEISLVC